VSFLKEYSAGVVILILMLIEAIIDVIDVFDSGLLLLVAAAYGYGFIALCALVMVAVDIYVIYQLYIFATVVGRAKIRSPENVMRGVKEILSKVLMSMFIAEIIWAVACLAAGLGLGPLYWPAVLSPLIAYFLAKNLPEEVIAEPQPISADNQKTL